MARVSIVAAIGATNRVLGKDNDLLWHIPEDMKRFKELTVGHPVIMGRKTYESIPEKFRPLPNRTNIIITRNPEYDAPGCIVVDSIEKALEEAREIEDEEICIMGGGEIYRQALPYTDRLYLTLVEGSFEGDTFFPEFEQEFTKIISREEKKDENHSYTFLTLDR